MSLDPRDRLTQGLTPALMVPRFGALPELEIGKARYLIGAGGVYVEARSRAVHGCALIAPAQGRLPYGDVTPFRRHGSGAMPPVEMLHRFAAVAIAASPDEAAAVIVWREGEHRLVHPEGQQAGVGRIRYSTRGIDPLDVAIDLHSHGPLAARFSAQDDADDLANPSPCFSAAVVSVDSGRLKAISSRLILNGWSCTDLNKPAQQLRGANKGVTT